MLAASRLSSPLTFQALIERLSLIMLVLICAVTIYCHKETIPFPAAIPNKIPSIPNHFSYSSLFPITKPLSTEFESPQANPTCLRFNHPKPTYNEFRPLFIANP